MKRILGSFNKRASSLSRSGQEVQTQTAPQGDFPEAIIVREMIAFCESSAPNSPTAGDEFLHLPAIVEAAESSPAAAREGANCIRKFLTKDYANRAYAQYNAVMLIRILTDNPGPTFTRNFDATFVKTVKDLLREGQDLSVQQILRETLDSFATGKNDNATLKPLMEMWLREKAKSNTKAYANTAPLGIPNGHHAQPEQSGNHFARQHRQPKSLPPPDELAARIEEAKTTAKLLSQTVQSTPNVEIPTNDLVKEFADRASSASRSIQGYIHSTNPAPDEDTLLTLIETNDQLSVAMSKHQRALLQARRTMSNSSPASTPPSHPQTNQENFAPPPGPPPAARGVIKPQNTDPPPQPPAQPQDRFYAPHHPDPLKQPQRDAFPPPQQQRPTATNYDITENPFADPSYPPPQQQHSLFGNRTSNQAGVQVGSDPSLQPRTGNQLPSH